MPTDRFCASTQYNDLKGSVAADRADIESMECWLRDRALLVDGERILGMSLDYGELPASGETSVHAVFLVAPIDTNLNLRIPGEEDPPTIVVRQIERNLSLRDFFRFFKRLNMTLSDTGEFEGRKYSYFL
ncbi:hypothetical protein [Rhodoferax sp. U11-2br]|uniref:hypothetical protein n=1 Tax=Rhodoferax sp. U11-2br TaxID=2838878 RepID=UPI001BE69797|nr:hypothetical protein [Rhodoferax sp. U11-2br]MBT3066916.1 hypothetical protein [Rhodoferax sp. U11-2br]